MKTIEDVKELLKNKGYEVSINVESAGKFAGIPYSRLFIQIDSKHAINVSAGDALCPYHMYHIKPNQLVLYCDFLNVFGGPTEGSIQSLYNWIRICMPDVIKSVSVTMKSLCKEFEGDVFCSIPIEEGDSRFDDLEGDCFCKIPIEDGISESEDDRYNAYFNLVSAITHKGYSCHYELRDNAYLENGKYVKVPNSIFVISIEQHCKINRDSTGNFITSLPKPWWTKIRLHENEGYTFLAFLNKDDNGEYYKYPLVEDSLALLEWINENLLPNPENDDDKPAKANNNQYLDSLLASVTKGSWIDDDALFEVLRYPTNDSFYAIKKLLEFYRDNRTV